jgi:hypothetical protein
MLLKQNKNPISCHHQCKLYIYIHIYLLYYTTNTYNRTKSDSPWHIRVLGLPHTGAKSRVETQIKICLQLVDIAGELATNWSHLKLPEHLVAKDKLKRKNQQKYGGAADEKTSLNDSQVLILEAAVVCDGQPDNEIIMCTSCVHREVCLSYYKFIIYTNT